MYTEDQIVELFEGEISEVCQAAGMTEDDQRSASRDLVQAAVSTSDREQLMVGEIQEGELVQLVHYDLVAAFGFLASLVGGVAGAGNPFLVACAVIGCLASLKGLKETTSRAEGLLFLTLYESKHRVATRKQAEGRFGESCGMEEGVDPEDFGPAMQGLLDLGCIREVNGSLSVKNPVIIY